MIAIRMYRTLLIAQVILKRILINLNVFWGPEIDKDAMNVWRKIASKLGHETAATVWITIKVSLIYYPTFFAIPYLCTTTNCDVRALIMLHGNFSPVSAFLKQSRTRILHTDSTNFFLFHAFV